MDGGCDDDDLHLDCSHYSRNDVITFVAHHSSEHVGIDASAPDLNIETMKKRNVLVKLDATLAPSLSPKDSNFPELFHNPRMTATTPLTIVSHHRDYMRRYVLLGQMENVANLCVDYQLD